MYLFPFGEPVRPVIQLDRTPKRVFVLGVYASAVHARWLDAQSKTRINALAVASEPYIFWRGDGAESIIGRISIPSPLGRLLPAASNLNGPSGIALDHRFLSPLGLERNKAWLCDLVPHSCMNAKQKAALEREYLPLAEKFGLPVPTLPAVPSRLADEKRVQEIVSELEESRAEILILLGDEPIRWFLRHFDTSWSKLFDFGMTNDTYGKLHEVEINHRRYKLLPLVHPRQAAALGAHSGIWRTLHEHWQSHIAPTLV